MNMTENSIKVKPFRYKIVCKDCNHLTSIILIEKQRYQMQIVYNCYCQSLISKSESQNISLYQYTTFVSSTSYSSHKCFNHNCKSGIIYSTYLSSFICFNCFFPIIYREIYSSIYSRSSIPFAYSNLPLSKFSKSLKESSCIRSIVSLSNYKIAMLIDKRISIWDYSIDKVLMNFFDNNYITELVPLKDEKKLLSYGYSLCVWDLLSLENSKRPDLPYDYYMIQLAIELSDGKIAFITQDGAFVWDTTTGEYHNVCSCYHITTVFLYEMPEDNLVFCSNDILYSYSITYDVTNRILLDDNIVLGELLSDYRIILLTEDKQLQIFQLGNKGQEEENQGKLEHECIYTITLEAQTKDWAMNCLIKELIDGTILLFYDNQIFIFNTINGELRQIFKEKGKINKIALLKGDTIGILMNSSSFILYDAHFNQKQMEFTEKYGIISTFNELSNGNIAISEIIQEFFYLLKVFQ